MIGGQRIFAGRKKCGRCFPDGCCLKHPAPKREISPVSWRQEGRTISFKKLSLRSNNPLDKFISEAILVFMLQCSKSLG
jgi:hypothetical protein